MEVYLNLEPGDIPRNHARPCDEGWVDSVLAKCAAHGIKKLFVRVSWGRAWYPSKVLAPIDSNCGERWRSAAAAFERMDLLATTVEAAHRHGIELWAWWPFSETHIRRVGTELVDPFYDQRTHLYWCNRDASRYFLGHPCLADPEVQQRYLLMAQEISDYGVDGILMSTRTHCYIPGELKRARIPFVDDEFGFNWPVVQAFEERYGVNIAREDFDNDAWQQLKGEYLTDLWRKVSNILKPQGQKLWVNISPHRYRFISNGYGGQDALRMYKDWKTWIDQDMVDGIVVVTPRDQDPGPTVVDVSPLQAEVPNDKLYIWTMCMPNRPPSSERREDLTVSNFILRPPEVFAEILAKAKAQGVAGVLAHEMYNLFFADSGGRDIGIGPVPRDEYWPVIETAMEL